MFSVLTAAARSIVFNVVIKPQGQSARGMAQKLKTHSGAKKRFFPTSNGNYKRWKVGLRHLNSSFSPERVNRLSRSTFADNTQKRLLRKLMPYK